MTMKLLAFVLLATAAAGTASAQTTEIVFTPSVVRQALDIKEALQIDNTVSSNALAFVGATPERKRAYADKVAGVTAVVIVGEDAVKALTDVPFSVPVIVVNATGPVTAKRTVRVFDTRSSAAPAGTTPVRDRRDVGGLLGAENDVALKGEVGSVVWAVLLALK